MRRFHGNTYLYPTPDDGMSEIGVVQRTGGMWVVAWFIAGGYTKRVQSSNLPEMAAPDPLQAKLDAWAAKRGLKAADTGVVHGTGFRAVTHCERCGSNVRPSETARCLDCGRICCRDCKGEGRNLCVDCWNTADGMVSDCCGAPAAGEGGEDVGICPKCLEHCAFEKESS